MEDTKWCQWIIDTQGFPQEHISFFIVRSEETNRSSQDITKFLAWLFCLGDPRDERVEFAYWVEHASGIPQEGWLPF